MTDIVPAAVLKRLCDEMLELSLGGTTRIALAYAGMTAVTLVSRNGGLAQATRILGDHLAVVRATEPAIRNPIEVPESVVEGLRPFAQITGSILPTRIPMPTVEASTYADGYRAGRRSLEPFLDYSKFSGRLDDLPIAKGA